MLSWESDPSQIKKLHIESSLLAAGCGLSFPRELTSAAFVQPPLLPQSAESSWVGGFPATDDSSSLALPAEELLEADSPGMLSSAAVWRRLYSSISVLQDSAACLFCAAGADTLLWW